MTEYALEIDGDEYQPVPESWVDHPAAVDPSPTDGVRLYATSAAVTPTGRALRIRYVHPRRDGVLRTYEAAEEVDAGLVPAKLAKNEPWPRSWVPRQSVEPSGIIRQPERDHFIDLWADRLDDLEADGRVAVADGGQPTDGTERFEKTTRREIHRCSECDEFELEKKFSGAAGTPGEEEYDRIEAPDQCPVCGGEIEREVVA